MASANHQRPQVVLLPAAGFQPANYEKLSVFLNARGFGVTPVALPTSNGSRPPTGTYEQDVAAIRAVVNDFVGRGIHVFMLMHGWSALPGCDALRDLTLQHRRQQRLSGGVVHLFLMGAFVVDQDTSLWSGITERARTLEMMIKYCIFHSDGAWEFKDPVFALFLDLEQHDQEEQTKLLRTFNMNAWYAEVRYCAWKDVACTYFAGQDDLACPHYIWQMMIDSVRRLGGEIRVHELVSSHSMHVKCTAEISQELSKVSDEITQQLRPTEASSGDKRGAEL